MYLKLEPPQILIIYIPPTAHRRSRDIFHSSHRPQLGRFLSSVTSTSSNHRTLRRFSQMHGPIFSLQIDVLRRVVLVLSPDLVEEFFTDANDVVLSTRPHILVDFHIDYHHTPIAGIPYILETIDLAKDPYFMPNHLGRFLKQSRSTRSAQFPVLFAFLILIVVASVLLVGKNSDKSSLILHVGQMHCLTRTHPTFTYPLQRCLSWRQSCTELFVGGGGYVSSSSPAESSAGECEAAVAGKKVLEMFLEECEIGSHKTTLETGKIARFCFGYGQDESAFHRPWRRVISCRSL